MAIDIKEIEHLAGLSALKFDEKQLEKFRYEFEGIMNFVSQIQNSSIKAEVVYDKACLLEDLREDEAKPGMTNEEVLLNAPKKAQGAFSVPLMIE